MRKQNHLQQRHALASMVGLLRTGVLLLGVSGLGGCGDDSVSGRLIEQAGSLRRHRHQRSAILSGRGCSTPNGENCYFACLANGSAAQNFTTSSPAPLRCARSAEQLGQVPTVFLAVRTPPEGVSPSCIACAYGNTTAKPSPSAARRSGPAEVVDRGKSPSTTSCFRIARSAASAAAVACAYSPRLAEDRREPWPTSPRS